MGVCKNRQIGYYAIAKCANLALKIEKIKSNLKIRLCIIQIAFPSYYYGEGAIGTKMKCVFTCCVSYTKPLANIICNL